MRIRWLERAARDLQHAENFMAKDDPHAAVRMVLRVIETVKLLGSNPSMGRAGRVEGTRELVVNGTPFIVPYRVREGRIEVLRVFHHAQKWPESV